MGTDEPLFPKPNPRADGKGRPPAPNRTYFESILWILQTGAASRFLPDEFPSPSTCWRRLQKWQEEGVWLSAWLGQFRRLLVRHDYLLSTCYALFYLACFWIRLRRYS